MGVSEKKRHERGRQEVLVNRNNNFINNTVKNSSLSSPLSSKAVADSDTTRHYLTSIPPYTNRQVSIHPIPIKIQTGK